MNFCVQNTPLLVNALQTILTILKLNTDLHTEISDGPHHNVWQEIKSPPRTSKMGLRGKGDKYFIRLGREKIDCPEACLISPSLSQLHQLVQWKVWPLSTNTIFHCPPVREKNLIWFHQTASVLLALTTRILLLKCNLINGFWINSSITRWSKSTEKGICKILYWYLKVAITPENTPVLPTCIWQPRTPQHVCRFIFSYCQKRQLANWEVTMMHFTGINYQIFCVLTQTLTNLFDAKQRKRQLPPSEVFQSWDFNNNPKQSQAQPQQPDLRHKFIVHFV